MSADDASVSSVADGGAVDEPRPTMEVAEERGSTEYDRGISFFDTVYAFAATLLIANVDPPPLEQWHSLESLAQSDLAIQLFGLALSFTVIAVMWRANVRITRQLRGLDGVTITLNLLAAGLVVLLPFTTQGISDSRTTMLALPTAVYAINVALASLVQIVVFQVGRARGLERVPTTRGQNLPLLIDELITPLWFLLSVPIALWDASIAKWFWMGLLVIGPISGAWAARRSASAGADSADLT